jgi:hypothetical protein
MADSAADTFINRVSEMADELGLTGDERNDYIHRHASAKGYKMVPTWIKEGGDGDTGGGFFGSGGGKKQSGKKSGGGWFPESD